MSLIQWNELDNVDLTLNICPIMNICVVSCNIFFSLVQFFNVCAQVRGRVCIAAGSVIPVSAGLGELQTFHIDPPCDLNILSIIVLKLCISILNPRGTDI